MNNVSNWDNIYPTQEAFKIFRDQYKEFSKAKENYESNSSPVKHDSYLQTEFSKLQKHGKIIRGYLQDYDLGIDKVIARNFLIGNDTNVNEQAEVTRRRALIDRISGVEKEVIQCVRDVDNQYQATKLKLHDLRFTNLLDELSPYMNSSNHVFGSRCGVTASKVLQYFSKGLNSYYTKIVQMLYNRAVSTNLDEDFNITFKSGIDNLKDTIRRDLKSDVSKIYYCSFEKNQFEDRGGWKHPNYGGHAFVIEKNAQDKFRIYQSYVGEYSLKAQLLAEMKKYPDGLRDYDQLKTFLNGLKELSVAKTWDAKLESTYSNCFNVKHKSFLGESLPQGFFNLSFMDIPIKEVEIKKVAPDAFESFEESSKKSKGTVEKMKDALLKQIETDNGDSETEVSTGGIFNIKDFLSESFSDISIDKTQVIRLATSAVAFGTGIFLVNSFVK